jgi:hypothetical protein
MGKQSLRIIDEARRIDEGPRASETPSAAGIVLFIVSCPSGANAVLERATTVLKLMDEAVLAGWPANENVRPLLPEWFRSACISEQSREQVEQWLTWWRSLPPDERARVELEQPWDLETWLHWMEPSNRQWFWWDANIPEGARTIALELEVDGSPFPWGALRWLFRAAGASSIEPAVR